MKRQKQLLMAMLCTFAMLSNNAAVVAQSKDKQQEPKSNTQRAPEVPSDVFWIGEPGQEPTFHVALAGPGQEFGTFAVPPQVEFIHNEFNFDSKVVKGAPYSADAVTETIQTMGDGNRIIRNSSAKIYRDSAGRTRREQSLNAVGGWSVSGAAPTMIFINDPVAGVQYNLEPNSRTANKMTVQRVRTIVGDKIATENFVGVSGKVTVRGEGSGDQVRFVTDDNRTVILSSDDKASAEIKAAELKMKDEMKEKMKDEMKAKMKDEMKAKMKESAGVAVTSGFSTSGDGVFAFTSEGEVNKESLGAQTIEGVQAEGTRVTFTIPAGKIGNERPIVSVNERWYSPELQAVVLSKNSDPRMGETTYRLTNITRSEPDPGLFQVPADYTIKEGGFGFSYEHADALKKHEMERRTRKPNDN